MSERCPPWSASLGFPDRRDGHDTGIIMKRNPVGWASKLDPAGNYVRAARYGIAWWSKTVGDQLRRADNLAAGHRLCARCDGTGNELYSMWKRCTTCGGSGVDAPAMPR